MEDCFEDRALVLIDKRGCGLSDPISAVPTTDGFASDIGSVIKHLDLSGCVLVCAGEAGLFGPQVGLTFPELVAVIVFINATPKMFSSAGYEHGLPESVAREFGSGVTSRWGLSDHGIELSAPGRAGDPEFAEWASAYQKQIASPGSIRLLAEYTAVGDSRMAVSKLAMPSLILQSRHTSYFRRSTANWLEEHLTKAELHWLESDNHLFWLADPSAAAVRIQSFMQLI